MPASPSTYAASIAKLYSARLIIAWEKSNIYSRFSTDVSSEIRPGSNQVDFSRVLANVTVRDYTRNTDIEEAEVASSTAQNLSIDNEKYFHIAIDDLDAIQTTPNVMDEHTRRAGVALAEYEDDVFYGLHTDAITSARTIKMIPTGDSELTGEDIIKALLEAKVKLQQDDLISRDVMPYVIMSPAHEALVMQYFMDKGNQVGALTSDAFVKAEIMNLLGFQMNVSVKNNDARFNNPIFVGVTRNIFYASQISKVELYRPEKRFGNAIKGLWAFGVKNMVPHYQYTLTEEVKSA